MNDSVILEYHPQSLPVSFKIIGVGAGATDIIEHVKQFDYDCVGCLVANDSADCVPTDEDKMAIIFTKDDTKVADEIARSYHDAGVLTIGLVPDADYSCYDSIAADAECADLPETVRNLLQPVLTNGYICYDFNDLCTNLKGSHSFRTLTTSGKNVEDAVANMQEKLEDIALQDIEYLSAHIYFNRERRNEIRGGDIVHLSNMISSLPDSISVIWSVNIDDTLPEDSIRLTIIMSGKEL